tara:strand:- start:37 stop:450 length:414 start_codon:yes stop_codon:yes gene_type:complete
MKETEKYRFANENATDIGIQYEIPTDGLFQVHWSNGNLRYEWYYKNGKRADGVSKSWHENGQLKQEITWKDGKLDGLYSWFYPSGQKRKEGTFKNGKENGLRTFWYENGQIKSEKIYKDGEIISKSKWNEDGKSKKI